MAVAQGLVGARSFTRRAIWAGPAGQLHHDRRHAPAATVIILLG